MTRTVTLFQQTVLEVFHCFYFEQLISRMSQPRVCYSTLNETNTLLDVSGKSAYLLMCKFC